MTAAAVSAPSLPRPVRRRRCRRVGLALLCDRAVEVKRAQPTAQQASHRQLEGGVPSEYTP
jgi:hypothetical protein